ncbi:YIEGIA family protein [Paenibacillus ginsengarvi]|uniref:YIEGIA protein n=1 Tax=Paenibacillus ginsengarvi TaxID=400777 RepID=A0A3B0CF44_9BACL|nr:YIEGIA family protein [Paenibacillus ginsengarvi]RKN84605.1 hypothetical protein D7M11_11455 [Paenibacillus ginsengarvi]
MIEQAYAHRYTASIIVGIVLGLVARLTMLRTDYRQYPTYPHGRIIHIALGVIAAALGSVAVPALFDKNYTAITFLTVAAQQFRDVRNMERNTLSKLDEMELVPRGGTYIEGIAMVFEGRNYLVIFTAFVGSLFTVLWGIYWGIACGAAAVLVSQIFKSGKSIAHAADVESAEVRIDGPDLYVGNIYMMNVGLSADRDTIRKQALGFILKPKNCNFRVSLANLGQRQAILHDLATTLGVYRDSGEPALVPMGKLDMNDGRLALYVPLQEPDAEKAQKVLLRVPLLESAVRMPSESAAQPKKGGA